MTNSEKIETVKVLFNDETVSDAVVGVYLTLAASKMLKRLYPFDSTKTAIPENYDMDQCELTVRMLARRGAEGEISHNENDIDRTYGSVDDEDILSRITPMAKIMV